MPKIRRPRPGTPFPHIQGHGIECGPTSLAMVLSYWGLPNLQDPLADLAEVTTAGTNMQTLGRVAQQFGFEPGYFQAQFEALQTLDTPFIAHVKGNHFVVVYRVTRRGVYVADPLSGKSFQSKSQFCKDWGGIVMTLTPIPGFDDPFVETTIRAVLQREGQVRAEYRRWLQAHLPHFAAVLPAALLLPLCLLIPIPMLQHMLDQTTQTPPSPLLLLLPLLYGLGLFLKGMAQARLDRDLGGLVTRAFFHHLAHLPTDFFDNHKNEDLLIRVQENEACRRFVSESPHVLAANAILAVATVVLLGRIHSPLAPLFTALITAHLLVVRLFDARLKELIGQQRSEHAKVVVAFLDMLHGIHTLKLLSGEKQALAAWERKQDSAHHLIFRGHLLRHGLAGLLGLISASVYLAGAWLLMTSQTHKHLSAGALVAALFLFALYARAMHQLLELWLRYRAFRPAFSNLHDVFLQEREDAGKTHPNTTGKGMLALEDVVFRYQSDQEFPALNHVSLTLQPGEKVAILGGNGSGKSTLLKLMVGFYRDYQGTIRLDGRDVADLNPTHLRRRIFLFPQDVYVFDTTMAENLAYGKDDISRQHLLEAAGAADLIPVIEGLFYGLEHRIGNVGTSALSGGQRLKLGFARLFLSDPDIIILDEASSALDVVAESEILGRLYRHFADKTIITVTHHLNTLERVDRILVLDRGALVQDGNHATLMEEDGPYRRFIMSGQPRD